MKKISKTTKTSGNNKVVFFGSGPVAEQSLRLLLESFEVEAVVTKPSTVKAMTSLKKGLRVYAVKNRSELDELIDTKPFQSTLGILIDFGVIVSQSVIDYFSNGIINSHFSLLPEWRGADPITFSILSGQKLTGVSLMLLVEALDEGPLLAQSPYSIPQAITSHNLAQDLVELSSQMLQYITPLYLKGKIVPAPQESANILGNTKSTYSRKLTKDDGVLNWTKPAPVLEREIRAFIDWPKSRTKFGDIEVIITKAEVLPSNGNPGTIELLAGSSDLIVYCGKGCLRINAVKPIGKREMSAQEFLRGYSSRIGLKTD